MNEVFPVFDSSSLNHGPRQSGDMKDIEGAKDSKEVDELRRKVYVVNGGELVDERVPVDVCRLQSRFLDIIEVLEDRSSGKRFINGFELMQCTWLAPRAAPADWSHVADTRSKKNG